MVQILNSLGGFDLLGASKVEKGIVYGSVYQISKSGSFGFMYVILARVHNVFMLNRRCFDSKLKYPKFNNFKNPQCILKAQRNAVDST